MSESPIELRGKGGGVVFQGTQKPPGGGSQTVLVVRQYLDNDTILGLPTSGGLELVTSPGPGKMLWPLDAIAYCDTTAAVYSNLAMGGEFGIAFAADSGPGDFLNYLQEGNGNQNGYPGALLAYNGLAVAAFAPQAQVPDPNESFPTYAFANQGDVWEDQALKLFGLNFVEGNPADYEGGDPANFMVVSLRYSVLDLTP